MMITACPPTLKAKQLELGIISYKPGPGFEDRTCELCGTSIHIAPLQLSYIAKNSDGIMAVCFACARVLTDGHRHVEVLGAQGGEYLMNPPPPRPPNT